MKTIILDIINSDTSYNKSALKMLKRTNPELWGKILEVTSFLPMDSLPKQRCWHIINDIYTRPVCPVTGELVKWNENRYLSTANRRAKQLHKWANGDYLTMNNEDGKESRRQGNLLAVANGRKYRGKETYTEDQKEKQRNTFLQKYGVDNPSKALVVRKKIYEAGLARGNTPKHLKESRQVYQEAVYAMTKISWREHFDKINPLRINRTENSLDHIYSVQQGFNDNIPPYIIGHWTNLRMLTLPENSSKGMRCDKTQDQLFEDFFSTIDK
jgi:hypothetical protein